MKTNLENAFKESLKDYKAPYDPKAWEAVSARLDARASAAAGNGSSSILKWTATCVLISTFIVGVYYLNENANTQNESTLTKTELNNNRTDGNRTNPSAETTVTENTNIQNNDNQTGTTTEKTLEALALEQTGQSNTPQSNDSKYLDEVQKSNAASDARGTILNDNVEDNGHGSVPVKPDTKATQFIAGRISVLDICEGGKVVINNPSKDKSLVKFQSDNGKMIVLDPGKSFVFKPKASTIITFADAQNEPIEMKQITVHSLPSVNFTYEANIFEKGLPIVICEAYGEYASYSWSFDDKTVKDEAVTLYNFFKKGDHDVALKVIDRNGCENTIKKTVQIRNNYNLMAVGAFRPNGSDHRNQTFMPYSLTERNVKFQLTIIDPTDNGVVFTSKDAKNAWDGTDQRTGEMTASNKTFIWKVQIYNPVPNERPIYSGTIVHD